MEGPKKFPEERQPDAAVTVPSWAPGWTLPISSYVGVSAGPSRSPHASAGPEHVSLPEQPYQRAPLYNSDRNSKARPAGSREVVRDSRDKKGRDLRLSPPEAPPTSPSQVRLPQGSFEGAGKEPPFALNGGSAWVLGTFGETP